MLRLVPHYLQELDPAQDRTRILFERLGVAAEAIDATTGVDVIVQLRSEGYSRQLLARRLIDHVVRLQPLVSTVYVDSSNAEDLVGDLANRFPMETSIGVPGSAITVAVGADASTADLNLDAAGWLAAFEGEAGAGDDRNPIGALGAAAIGAGEVFKIAFSDLHPDNPLSKRFVFNSGRFSFWTMDQSSSSPKLDAIQLDGVLVGAGGVGAGVIVVFAELETRVRGQIRIVDPDRLDLYSLNRLGYALVADARAGRLKVDSAREYLAARSPGLDVVATPELYRDFARSIGARAERRFPLVMTGVDSDDIRWEVQRDLPLLLIDGATGTQANCRIDRVTIGLGGCIGCSRPPQVARPLDPAECDDPPDRGAPSISFLSAFAGTVVAAEAIKSSLGREPGASSYFEHSFIYPLNPELTGVPGFREDCPVSCGATSVLRSYDEKWESGR